MKEEILGGFVSSSLIAFIMGFLVFFMILFLALYIYLGFAFMAIGRKAKLKTPELAWIPFVGPLIIAYQASKMHWWPWLIWIIVPITFLVVFINPLLGILMMFIFLVFFLVFFVFTVIWEWKMFEAVNKPGWWALIKLGQIIPLAGLLFFIAQLILYGIAAWSKD
ncbi:MAG: hypothetical protein QXX68_02485 [Candidatus Pacearchaeota archaeon]